MGKLREYRRDQERIMNTLLERKDIKNIDEFEREYEKYMKGSQQDPTFKKGVLKAIKNKQGSDFKKTKTKTKIKRQRVDDALFIFAGQQKGKTTIQRAKYDKTVDRYRNERGQFVKKI